MIDDDLIKTRANILGSLLVFTQVFYTLRTGRQFRLSNPIGRESHFITIARALTRIKSGEITRLAIFVPPRYGKSELGINFVAATLAQWPSSNYIYTSYAQSLAEKQTSTIRDIITLPHYKNVFGFSISDKTQARGNFETTAGGSVYAAGSGGAITGRGAGIMDCMDFGGCILIDDIHKPTEVLSDTIRQSEIDWYYNTLLSRLNNGVKTPIIYIGQRLHEDDLGSHLIKDGGWTVVCLSALDENDNALYPEMHSRLDLLEMKRLNPYVFAAQMQQNPIPAGGGLYKAEDFPLCDNNPDILATFITSDTAETNKTYNDRTVFSFWGIHKITNKYLETDIFGLYWIDCVELNVEPKDLEAEFWQFYMNCMRFNVKPEYAAIEKKSTGVTLISVLNSMQGIKILPIERNVASGSKSDRFIQMQPYISKKLISLPRYGKHTNMCIEHMTKITANNSHRFDDIADTVYDAVKLSLIDKTLINITISPNQNKNVVVDKLLANMTKVNNLRDKVYSRQRNY